MDTKPQASAPAPSASIIRPRFGQAVEKRLHKSPASVAWDQERWPNFRPGELKCKCAPADKGCAGEYFHDGRFMDALQHLRDLAGRALVITSGRRCAVRNRRVGGAKASQHLLAIAADISLTGHDPAQLARHAVTAGFTGIGFGRTFLHVDMRQGREGFHYPGGKAAWTTRFGFDPAARFDATGKL